MAARTPRRRRKTQAEMDALSMAMEREDMKQQCAECFHMEATHSGDRDSKTRCFMCGCDKFVPQPPEET